MAKIKVSFTEKYYISKKVLQFKVSIVYKESILLQKKNYVSKRMYYIEQKVLFL